jgi:NitT/TauT family transport system ATP-binding protein
MLATSRYLNATVRVIAPSLLGQFDFGGGRIESVPDFHVFHRGQANVPTVEKAVQLQTALGAAGLLTSAESADPELPRRLFREDLNREILHHHVPNALA